MTDLPDRVYVVQRTGVRSKIKVPKKKDELVLSSKDPPAMIADVPTIATAIPKICLRTRISLKTNAERIVMNKGDNRQAMIAAIDGLAI
jgi:hypothetical protein